MDEDHTKGKPERHSGNAKTAWTELTDDDVNKVGKFVDRLNTLIQEKDGESGDAGNENPDE